MVNYLSGTAIALLGFYVVFNSKMAHRGGVTDFSYMHFNIIIGIVLVIYGILIIKTQKNKID